MSRAGRVLFHTTLKGSINPPKVDECGWQRSLRVNLQEEMSREQGWALKAENEGEFRMLRSSRQKEELSWWRRRS